MLYSNVIYSYKKLLKIYVHDKTHECRDKTDYFNKDRYITIHIDVENYIQWNRINDFIKVRKWIKRCKAQLWSISERGSYSYINRTIFTMPFLNIGSKRFVSPYGRNVSREMAVDVRGVYTEY